MKHGYWRCEALRRDGTRCPHAGGDYLFDGTTFVSLCGRHRTAKHARAVVARTAEAQARLPGVKP